MNNPKEFLETIRSKLGMPKYRFAALIGWSPSDYTYKMNGRIRFTTNDLLAVIKGCRGRVAKREVLKLFTENL